MHAKKQVLILSSSESIPIAEEIAVLLEEMNVEPILWNDIFRPGHYALTDLKKKSKEVAGAICIFNSDDTTSSRGKLFDTVRDNVLFEYGLFVGILEMERSVFLCNGNPKIPTDLSGITYIQRTESNSFSVRKKLRHWLDILPSHDDSTPLYRYESAFELEDEQGFEYINLTSGIYTNAFTIKPLVKNYRYHQTRYSWSYGGEMHVKPLFDYDLISDMYHEGEYNAYTLRLNRTLCPDSDGYPSGVKINVMNTNDMSHMFVSTLRVNRSKTKLWVQIPNNMEFKNIVVKKYYNASERSPYEEKVVFADKNYCEYVLEERRSESEYIVLEWHVKELS